nr:hypothetical protein [Acholeplasmatales bacterium]
MRKKNVLRLGIFGSLCAATLLSAGSNVRAASSISISTVGGYNEGAAITFTSASTPSVYYSAANADSWIEIDSELIRATSSGYRADILGLSAGTYDIKVSDGYYSKIAEDVTVTADDRSGYAHFNNTTGVGAYNNDGTLKSGAVVVYVTDETKNTVTATIGGTEYTGLSAIIQAQKNSSVPLDIRLLDEIQAQQWTYKAHGTGSTAARMTNLDETFASVNWETTSASQASSNDYYKIGEEDIISSGINTLSTTGVKYDADGNATEVTGITHLDGLTNVINKCKKLQDSGYYEYDSYYNELDVREASNITVEGVGDSAGIFQWGFCFNQCNSIEVKNLEFSSYNEDAIGIQGGSAKNMNYHNFWIHNCTFNVGVNNWDVCYENDKTDGDGSTDFKFAYDLTISYCRYNKTHKTALIGSSSSSYQYDVTFHHNYYYKC